MNDFDKEATVERIAQVLQKYDDQLWTERAAREIAALAWPPTHAGTLARIDATRRGDPLTPEDIARIRAQERRWATESRIRHEEWAKVQGFPYWPQWVFAVILLMVGLLGGGLVAVVSHSFR